MPGPHKLPKVMGGPAVLGSSTSAGLGSDSISPTFSIKFTYPVLGRGAQGYLFPRLRLIGLTIGPSGQNPKSTSIVSKSEVEMRV